VETSPDGRDVEWTLVVYQAFEELLDLVQRQPRLLESLEARTLGFFDGPVERLAAQLGELADRAMAAPADNVAILEELAGTQGIDLVGAFLGETDASERRTVDAQSRLRAQIDARIDMFQISVGEQWVRANRLAACLLAVASSTLIALAVHLKTAGWFSAGLVGFTLGGITAWVMRDAIALLRRLASP
jgi:hypothetical protein